MTFISFCKRYKNLFPLLILAVLCLENLYYYFFGFESEGGKSYYVLDIKDRVGIVILTISICIFFIKREWFAKTVIVMLLVGVFDVINFTHVHSYISIGVFSLQPLSIGIGLLYVFLNMDAVKSQRKEEREINEEILNIFSEEDFQKFRKQYATFTAEELADICNNNRYTKEARKAATVVLEEKSKA